MQSGMQMTARLVTIPLPSIQKAPVGHERAGARYQIRQDADVPDRLSPFLPARLQLPLPLTHTFTPLFLQSIHIPVPSVLLLLLFPQMLQAHSLLLHLEFAPHGLVSRKLSARADPILVAPQSAISLDPAAH